MSWDRSLVHQDFGATGKYSASNAIAQEYAGLEEDGGSRVDDGEGWREIKRDSPPKNAAEYEALVKKYAAAGFDVKAIDMDGDDFTHSNIAIKPSDFTPKGSNKPTELSPNLAHAKARVQQHEEDILTGKYTADLYDMNYRPDGAQSFLNRYKEKLGTQLENGNYHEKKYAENVNEERHQATTNSSKVASGANDNSVDTGYYARTGRDNRVRR
jgi:hypothetical protein